MFIEVGKPVTDSEKLDRLIEQGADTRMAVATLAVEVRMTAVRLDGHEAARVDFEQRLRALERRSYAIPGASVLIALAGLAVAVWGQSH